MQKLISSAKKFLREYSIGCIPRRFRLPVHFWWQRFRGKLEPELLFLLSGGVKSGMAIDVGANQGIYTYALAKIFERVDAFEPNKSVTSRLECYLSRKVTLHHYALSCDEGEATLYIPSSSRGVEYSGWASLDRKTLPATATAIRTKTVKSKSLDSFAFGNVAFIKIDVEGHELQVLEGAVETIARFRPNIMVEVKPLSRLAVWNFFLARQYQCFLLTNDGLKRVRTVGDFTASAKENFVWIPDQSRTWPSE